MKTIEGHLKHMKLVFVMFLIMGLAACDKDDDDNDNGNGNGQVSDQDEEFAVEAAYSNLAEIELGELAADSAVNDSIRGFAEMMVEDHTEAQQELEEIADSLEIDLPDTLKTEHQALLDRLDTLTGSAFDSVYISSQVTAHERAEEIMQTQIDEGENDELVDYATTHLPIISMHLDSAMVLRDSLFSE